MLKLPDLIEFSLHLGAFDRARLPLLESLCHVQEMPLSRALKEAVRCVIEKLKQGETFSQSLSTTKGFGVFLPVLMGVAEKTGRYAPFLDQAYAHFRWQQELRQTLSAASRYPLILLFLLSIMVFITVYLLVPGLEEHLKMLHVTEQSIFTQTLLGFTRAMVDFGGWILLGLGSAMMGLRLTRPLLFAQLLTKIPLVGTLIIEANSLAFFHVLATMLTANIHLLEALAHATQGLKNPFIRARSAQVREDVIAGKRLFEAFEGRAEIPALYKGYVQLGEKTGQLADVLLQACEHQGALFKRRLDKLLSLLQPTMVILMGLLLVWMILAVLIPLYGSIQTMEGLT